MSLPEQSSCPECGEAPSGESIVESRLSDLGYKHTDVKLECPECDNKWVHGIPEGENDTNEWVCDSCEGDLIPHFGYVVVQESKIEIRPKCEGCNYVPDERIEVESRFNGDNIRFFVGHHTVTGERTKDSEFPL